MDDFKYSGEIEEIEEENDRIPDIKQNEVNEKFAIALLIGIGIWFMLFILLRTFGVIEVWLMRVCVYPVFALVLIIYAIIKYKNRYM